MANELYPRRMVGGDMFAGLPGDASPISPGADDGSVQRQREAQEAAQRQAQQQAEQERQQAQQRYFEQLRQQQEEAETGSASRTTPDGPRTSRRACAREAEEARKARRRPTAASPRSRSGPLIFASAQAAATDALKDAADFVKSQPRRPAADGSPSGASPTSRRRRPAPTRTHWTAGAPGCRRV